MTKKQTPQGETPDELRERIQGVFDQAHADGILEEPHDASEAIASGTIDARIENDQLVQTVTGLADSVDRSTSLDQSPADQIETIISRLRGPDGRGANRGVSVAITHLETGILWLRREGL